MEEREKSVAMYQTTTCSAGTNQPQVGERSVSQVKVRRRLLRFNFAIVLSRLASRTLGRVVEETLSLLPPQPPTPLRGVIEMMSPRAASGSLRRASSPSKVEENQNTCFETKTRRRRGQSNLSLSKKNRSLKERRVSTRIETKTSTRQNRPPLPPSRRTPSGGNNLFLTLILPSLVGAFLLAGARSAAAVQTPANMSAAAADLFAISAPAFSPTRRPLPLAPQSLLQRRNQIVAQQQQHLLASASSPKFARSNELNSFFDDMNNNELRSIASGKPIDADLFGPETRHLGAPQKQHVARGLHLQQQSQQPQQQGQPSQLATSPSGQLETQPLVSSQSERQIYSDCALILQRTYVKNIDDPKHQLVPFGKTEQACISYRHIDKAVEQAKHKLKFREFARARKRAGDAAAPQAASAKRPAPLEVIHSSLEPPEDLIAAIGEINMATTQIIADQFDLSNDELLNGLPLIDMSKTKFWSICPLLVKQDLKCEPSRFRTFTGHCNNLKHPTWGAAMTPFARYLPPVHPDGIWAPRKSVVSEITFELGAGHRETHANIAPSMPVPLFHSNGELGAAQSELRAPSRGVAPPLPPPPDMLVGAATSHSRSIAQELPPARLVSSVVHRDFDVPNHDLNSLFASWGQLLDHDMTRAAQPPPSIKCCPQAAAASQPQQARRHKLCLPIEVPKDDPFYSKFNVECLEFRRTLAGVRPNCVLGPRVHQNAITSPIDANFVYGSSQAMADSLRLFKGGRLRDRNWFRRERLKPLLPAQEVEPDLECIARPRDLFCFLAGDVRVNEQTHLTVLHTLYMREHNRLADRLAELNPHWDDERLFHETRHIVAAGVQQVLINEYIPLLIGRKMAALYNLTGHEAAAPSGGGNDGDDGLHQPSRAYWHGHDPTVTTSVANSFAAAAFRQGHTFVQSTIERYNKFHEFVASEKLRHLFKQPFLLYQPGVVDELTSGMLNQQAQSNDPFISEEIAGHLFQPPELQFGHDLASINLQRGREQGLPGYNLFREWCGLPRAETFDQLEPYLTNHTAFHYARLYKHVDDIDLWSGGVSERKLPGAAVGPTFACIIARQFSNTRRGDSFWFENPGRPSSFTPDQLGELRKITLAKILCTNSDDLTTIQRWALRMAHPVLNPRLDCAHLPEMDLQYWQEE